MSAPTPRDGEAPAVPAADSKQLGKLILDLAPLLREEILIHTDKRILCKPDCKGLCPECGKNRNRETCDCEQDRIDPRFAALKDLLDSK